MRGGKTYNSYRDNPFFKYLTPEQREHAALVYWMRYALKQAKWHHTVNEGKRTPFERYLWDIMGGKKSIPDFLFTDPIGPYTGLALELKPTGAQIFRKDGKPLADKVDQWKCLEEFKERGWYATFASGIDEAMDIIKKYYNNEL